MHTKGPWEATKEHNPSEYIKTSFYIRADERLVAVGGLQGEETMDNARLIASAPELLEALLTIEDYVNNNWTDEEYHNADGTGWVTVINEAIRKAKGE